MLLKSRTLIDKMISLSSKQLSLVIWKAEIWIKCNRFLPLCVCQLCGLIICQNQTLRYEAGR